MKKTLLSTLVALCAAVSVSAQITFEWGTATWNIEDGRTYTDIDDFNAEGVVLTYPNPTDYAIGFFDVIAVNYNIYVDGSSEPIPYASSVRMGSNVQLSYNFVEGHSYRIVTTGAYLAHANIATYTTDTLSTNSDSYSISFSIQGPEFVKSIDVEGIMALTITDQEGDLTYSLIDANDICSSLGIQSIADAKAYGLNLNGSYNEHYIDYYDGWRDVDGEYTTYWGGYDNYHSHNAYPCAYCIKLNETCDTVRYYFYDYWKEYDPNASDTTGGISIGGSSVKQHRAYSPATPYNKVIWDWDNGDGTTTQYTRSYHLNEGQDYKASFIIIANKKAVKVNATLHFVSQEDYATPVDSVSAQANALTEIYSLSGIRQTSLRKGINIVRENGKVKKIMK